MTAPYSVEPASSPAPPVPDGGPRLGPVVLGALLAGPLLSMIDSNVVNVAIPDISRQLHGSLDSVQWTVSGYLLALAAALPAVSYLARRFGTVRVYAASLASFTVVSVACSLTRTVPELIAVRALQGAVAAPLIPLAMSLLVGPDSGRSRRVPGSAAIVVFLGPALGPAVGGLLVGTWGWPAIFLVNAPIGLAALTAVPALSRRGLGATADPAARLDLTGLLLMSAGLGLTLYGFSEGPLQGWLTPRSWPFWSAGALIFGASLAWERGRAVPAVDLRVLARAQSGLAVWLCMLTSCAMFAVVFLLPVVLQDVQGHSALASGLVLLPQGLLMGLSTRWGIRAARRGHLRAAVLGGTLAVGVCTALLLLITVSTPLWMTTLVVSLRGLGMGLVIQPLLVALLAPLAPSQLADATTLFNVGQRLGGATGVSLLSTFLALRVADRIRAVLAPLGARAGSAGIGDLPTAPAALHAPLAHAAVLGFHDTILAVVAIMAIALISAIFLNQPTGPQDVPPPA
jgi:EmrB/QacA subfamily drug resistance transporter